MRRLKMVKQVVKSLGAMVLAPVGMRRNPPTAPSGAEHYVIPELAASVDEASLLAVDVPKVQTPGGRWRDWPPTVLAACDEPLLVDAPDFRGVWKAHGGPMKGHIERIEQAGNRVVITAGGVIHDMFADGTLIGGVNDEGVGGAQIRVAARFERGRLNLYPNDKLVVVTRYLDGEELVWRWGPYTTRLQRLKPAVTEARGSDL